MILSFLHKLEAWFTVRKGASICFYSMYSHDYRKRFIPYFHAGLNHSAAWPKKRSSVWTTHRETVLLRTCVTMLASVIIWLHFYTGVQNPLFYKFTSSVSYEKRWRHMITKNSWHQFHCLGKSGSEVMSPLDTRKLQLACSWSYGFLFAIAFYFASFTSAFHELWVEFRIFLSCSFSTSSETVSHLSSFLIGKSIFKSVSFPAFLLCFELVSCASPWNQTQCSRAF